MELPPAITAFFTADQDAEATPPAEAFAKDAVVHDEGKTHRGRDAIAEWWLAAKNEYHHSAIPIEVIEQGAETRVRAEVTGQFPGSPVTLIFTFQLAQDQISGLEISA